MDRNALLSRFIAETKSEPGLAQDLLEGQNWHYEAALKDFKELQGQRRLSNQTNQAPPRTSPQAQRNGTGVQTPPNQSPRVNGQITQSTTQTRNGVSSGNLQKPVPRDSPRSPNMKRLQRGLSKANAQLVDIGRQRVIEDEERHDYQLVDTPKFTFILPDLTIFPSEFRAFVEKDLIDMCTMVNLENSGYLNWWAKRGACPKLWPMATTGDGNCLLHASSLGMWGFHDRQLTLRKALYKDLTEHQHTAHMQRLKRRWRWQQTLSNKESGLVYSEQEWEDEWKGLLKLASTEPRNQRWRNNGGKPTGGGTLPSVAEDQQYAEDDEEVTYESLEDFHVFVLCHILRRPIIIVADTVLRDAHGQPLAPIPFGGIYLPLECHPAECHRSPLVLTYDAAHFSALVPMEVDSHRRPEPRQHAPVIPITDANHQLLPLHFIVDPGVGWQWKDENHNTSNDSTARLVYSPEQKVELLRQYLDLTRIVIPAVSPDGPGEEWELLPPKENGVTMVKVDVARSNSSGSDKSDKSGHKEKERSKSLGKKLKHFAGLDKSKKHPRKDAGEDFLIVDGVHSPRTPVSISDVVDRSIIVAAIMNDKRLQGHEEMIRNYLESAKAQFKEENALRRMLAEENRARQQRNGGPRYEQQPPPPLVYDDDEITNNSVYSYTTIPRARIGKPAVYSDTTDGRSQPRGVPQRQERQPMVTRGVPYMDAANGSGGHVLQTRSHPGSPSVERVAGNAMYNPAMQQGPYSPQPVRVTHHNQTRYSPQVNDRRFIEKSSIPGKPVYVEDTRQLPRDNVYATHVRGRKVPLSTQEKGSRPCRTYGCQFFGSEKTDYLCSKCYGSIMRQKLPAIR